jgi:hypothetical protein
VITRAVLCPSTPLLARQLSGREPVLPDLRDACAAAAERLVKADSEVVAVVGAGAVTRTWDADSGLDLATYVPSPGVPAGTPGLPLALGLGALLLDQAGYKGPRLLQAVGDAEAPAACGGLGASLATTADRVGLLVVGDGSNRRGPSAPGHLDERAAPFDAKVQRAVRDGDMAALAGLDPALARDLMATGRAAWQVLAGALGAAPRPAAEILYADDPFGVAYLVAVLEPASSGPANSAKAP